MFSAFKKLPFNRNLAKCLQTFTVPSVAHGIQNQKETIQSVTKTKQSNITHSADSVNCYCKVVVSNGSTASFNGPHWFTRELKRICLHIKENIKKRWLLGGRGDACKVGGANYSSRV